MIEIRQPAPFEAALRLAFPDGTAPRQHLRAMTLQLTGESYGLVKDGALLVAFGLVPLVEEVPGQRLFEFWLLIDGAAVPHLPALVKMTRLIFARLAQGDPVAIRALVRVGHEPGRRLARLVGLRPRGVMDGLEIWEWRDGKVRKGTGRRPVDELARRRRLEEAGAGRRERGKGAAGSAGRARAPGAGSAGRRRHNGGQPVAGAPDAARPAPADQ